MVTDITKAQLLNWRLFAHEWRQSHTTTGVYG
jgi:hypothetical protein